ncbi:MAG: CpsB/CapC family capsule biosynthesis tyrosine phosphatase [Gemmatimonadota bacterium]|nr:CpsB/CapC family capsule biosynthesis tyrosine phosphatase [Gemmatimonadota bacterium]
MSVPLIDIHSHVLPAVDDGAADLDEALRALGALEAQGVRRVVATPHFRASLLERPARAEARLALFDEAYETLVDAVAGTGLEIGIGRACEFKLDAPIADLADPRLRLDGTRHALVEFGAFQLPPFAGNQLKAVRDAGWVPVLAHPERYFGIERAFDRVGQWVADGTLLQVNARSLAGGYGTGARDAAIELLAHGWVTCIASDYHSRGRPEWPDALELLATARRVDEHGAASGPRAELDPKTGDWVRRLVHDNPARLLADEAPDAVAPRRVDPATGGAGRTRSWL